MHKVMHSPARQHSGVLAAQRTKNTIPSRGSWVAEPRPNGTSCGWSPRGERAVSSTDSAGPPCPGDDDQSPAGNGQSAGDREQVRDARLEGDVLKHAPGREAQQSARADLRAIGESSVASTRAHNSSLVFTSGMKRAVLDSGPVMSGRSCRARLGSCRTYHISDWQVGLFMVTRSPQALTLSRSGQPRRRLVRRRQYLPNPVLHVHSGDGFVVMDEPVGGRESLAHRVPADRVDTLLIEARSETEIAAVVSA